MNENINSNFEAALGQRLFTGNAEKTFLDKILSRKDAERIRDLMRKTPLQREDLLELLNLLSGVEAKLVNLDEWGRYVTLKYFVWIREFIKINMMLFDYKDESEKNQVLRLNDRSRRLLDNNIRLMEHNTKFLIDLYLNINRSTLSLGGSAFFETLKNKFEIGYNQPAATPVNKQDAGFFGNFLKR